MVDLRSYGRDGLSTLAEMSPEIRLKLFRLGYYKAYPSAPPVRGFISDTTTRCLGCGNPGFGYGNGREHAAQCAGVRRYVEDGIDVVFRNGTSPTEVMAARRKTLEFLRYERTVARLNKAKEKAMRARGVRKVDLLGTIHRLEVRAERLRRVLGY
jgi:hypothetical protein